MLDTVGKIVRSASIAALVLLAGCGSEFKISYDQPVDPSVSRGWNVTEVRVSVPDSLVVSEAKSIFPQADIVWREDPPGDRRAQVAKIMRDAISQGAEPLKGPRKVRIEVTMTRFHALTFEAESRLTNSGVHNVKYVAQVVDVASGTILFGPQAIESDIPGNVGGAAVAARARGETQKVGIMAAVRRTTAGWLGIGPDPRTTFNRLGG